MTHRPPSRQRGRPTASNYQPERRADPPLAGNHHCSRCPAWIEGHWVDQTLVSITLRHSYRCPVQPGVALLQPLEDWQPPAVTGIRQ